MSRIWPQKAERGNIWAAGEGGGVGELEQEGRDCGLRRRDFEAFGIVKVTMLKAGELSDMFASRIATIRRHIAPRFLSARSSHVSTIEQFAIDDSF